MRAVFLSLAVSMGLMAFSKPVWAGESGDAAAQAPALGETNEPPHGRSTYKLFDKEHSTVGFSAQLSLFRAHTGKNNSYFHGTELAFGTSVTARHGIFILGGITQTDLRIFGDRGFAWSILTYSGRAGVLLGPVEAASRIGFSLATVGGDGNGFIGALLSPRAGFDVGVRLGPWRIEGGAYSELMWRFYGESYRVQGISFGLRFEQKARSPLEK
jgi:hypothetical protein